MIRHVAYIAMHSSPLLQPGTGNAGGMNVYLDRLARTMVGRDVRVTAFTRRTSPDHDEVIEVLPGYRVVHVTAGPEEPMTVGQMKPHAPAFAKGVIDWITDDGDIPDLVHSHYWLSGRAGVRVKETFDIPLANSFHTLGKVKNLTRAVEETPASEERLLTEEDVIARSNCVIASTPFEFDDLLEHYGASPERLCVSPPGVDHAVFRPGDRWLARERLGVDERPTVLYVGRIQSHKGTALAVEAFADLTDSLDPAFGDPVMRIIGGSSGADGAEELERAKALAVGRGVDDAVEFVEPLPHAILADHYRAADVVIVPSRSETFGLVAAEAQACGTPVVASNVGGLAYVVNASESGLLVDGHNPQSFAAAMRAVIAHASFAERLSEGAVSFSQRFSWDSTANRLLELYEGISA